MDMTGASDDTLAVDGDSTDYEAAVEEMEAAIQAEENLNQISRAVAPTDIPTLNLANGPYDSSPIELRIFGLFSAPGYPSFSFAKDHIGDLIGADKLAQLEISSGNPANRHNEHTSIVSVRCGRVMWLTPGLDLARELDQLRVTFIECGLETYWSCARTKDRRDVAYFTFTPRYGDHCSTLPAKEAVAAVTRHCKNVGCEVAQVSASYSTPWTDYTTSSVIVRLKRPYSMAKLRTLPPFNFEDYEVSFSVDRSVILPDYPSTIVFVNAGKLPADLLLQELWRWIASYNETNGTNETLLMVRGQLSRVVHDRHFVVTPSTVHLALYICEQQSACGGGYELTYHVNQRGDLALRARDGAHK